MFDFLCVMLLVAKQAFSRCEKGVLALLKGRFCRAIMPIWRLHVGVLLFPELIDTVYICLNTGRYDISIGSEAIIHLTVVFHLHVHLSYIVRAL